MLDIRRTGELKAHTGLVDYIADGECLMGAEWIPCQIGYLEYECDDVCENRPVHVFFNDGFTDKGTHYNKATFLFSIGSDFNIIGGV